MRTSQAQAQRELDLSRLPGALKRNALRVGLAAVMLGGLTYAGLTLVPSRYKAEAQIRIGVPAGAEIGRGGAGGSEVAASRLDKEAIASRVQELRSPDLARKLATELRLGDMPEFNSAVGDASLLGRLLRIAGIGGPRPGETEEERVLAAYYRALEVYQVKETRVITLGFTARDGEIAATAANRLIELYQNWLRQQGVSETADANAWLVPEIEKRAGELATAEAETERFRSTANLFRSNASQQGSLAEQQLTDLNSELTKARAQRTEAEARAAAARELMNRGVPDAIPDVQKSPVIQGLIAQRVRAERDLAEASSQLLPGHPRMKQLNANVADIRRQVQREARTVVDGLERELKALSLREELASRAVDDAKQRVGGAASDRVRLAQLEDDVKAKRRELELLRDRYEASRSRTTTKSVPVEVQVIATALPSTRPSWPNRPWMSALAAGATLVLGFVGVLFRELLGGVPAEARRTPEAARLDEAGDKLVEATAERPRGAAVPSEVVVTAVPAVAAQQRTRVRKPAATGREQADLPSTIARVQKASAGKQGYRSLILCGDANIDVREEAADFAAGLASPDRHVVLVDWSLDGKGIADGLGIPSAPGFMDLLAGTASFDDVVHPLPDGDVHVVPCGAANAMGAQSIDPNRLNLLLDALDEAYAYVVITGRQSAIRDLFEAIEGRIDCAVVVIAPGSPRRASPSSNELLGFEVTDIDVMHLETDRIAQLARKEPKRLARSADAMRGASSAGT